MAGGDKKEGEESATPAAEDPEVCKHNWMP
jgi:hypothetical protein